VSDNGAILVAEQVVKTYDRGRIHALDGVDLSIAAGEFVSIVGPSGSGKSTLLHVLGALDRPDGGRILLAGRDLAGEPRLDRVRARSIGFVFQLHNLLPTLTARENVEVPMRAVPGTRAGRRQRAAALLETVGLADRAGHRPAELSGGERQRVAIARALANEPSVILADEPTGDLDRDTGRRIMGLLADVRAAREVALVLVTHDPDVAAMAGRCICLVDGRVSEPRA